MWKDTVCDGVVDAVDAVKGCGWVVLASDGEDERVFLHSSKCGGKFNEGDAVQVRVKRFGQAPPHVTHIWPAMEGGGPHASREASGSPGPAGLVRSQPKPKPKTQWRPKGRPAASSSSLCSASSSECEEIAASQDEAPPAQMSLRLWSSEGTGPPRRPAPPAGRDTCGGGQHGKLGKAKKAKKGKANPKRHRFDGVVEEVSEDGGSIHCRQAWQEFDCSVRISPSDCEQLEVNDRVQFVVCKSNHSGPPVAEELQKIGAGCQVSDELQVGRVKMYDTVKGFGFIECEDTMLKYATDVFLGDFEARECVQVGHVVSFQLRCNRKGQPQAFNVVPAAPLAVADAHRPPLGHRGVVKKIDPIKGYGFILCQEMHNMYGHDVFVDRKMAKAARLSEGDAVSFSVQMGQPDRPQALEVLSHGPAVAAGACAAGAATGAAAAGACGASSAEEAQEPEQRINGVIKSFTAETGYGFLTGPEVLAKYGRDVFLHSRQIKDFCAGDAVSFAVKLANGKPQACDLLPLVKSLGWLDVGGAAASGSDDPGKAREVDKSKKYIGEVKSFSTTSGYGFIQCEELHGQFGRDVFLHQSQYEGLSVGDRVKFRVQVKNGQPQALDLVAACTAVVAGQAPPSSGQVPQGCKAVDAAAPEPARAANLDRDLQRACASARPESCGTIADLLAAGASANAEDAIGYTPLMIAALNVRNSERKCKLLLQHGADIDVPCCGELNAVQWARERLNGKFAAFLTATRDGRVLEGYEMTLDILPNDDF